ncbi:MFS transporter [Actinokineospora enzanensis]|uniref:MFS transporter n=1 Tax=Actinokineospora enzanensis TaxID=155975 RepID=UPI0012EC9431|nr:MFS transporter [Actinokineospora enzanensis]
MSRAPGPAWPPMMRLFAGGTLVNAFGNGLFMVGSLLFFTRVLGLAAAAVGVGLTVAEIVGLAVSAPISGLADRFGARRVLCALLLVQGAATLLLLLPRSLAWFTAVAILYSVGQKAARGVNNALIAIVGADDRVVVRARLRSVNNLGMSVGSLAAGVAVAVDTPQAYTVLFVVDAMTFLGAAALLWQVRWAAASSATGVVPSLRAVLRDLRYLRLTAVNAVVSLQYSVLTVALPLWLADRTSAPRWLLSVLLAVNTMMVVLFQVRASVRITSVTAAAAHLRRAAVLFLVGVSALGLAALAGPWLAAALLLAGVVVHTVAELWHAAAAFEASVALAEPDRHGAYQGVFALGQGIAESLAPVALLALCLGLGVPGWFLVAAALLAGGVLMASQLDSAERRGQRRVGHTV